MLEIDDDLENPAVTSGEHSIIREQAIVKMLRQRVETMMVGWQKLRGVLVLCLWLLAPAVARTEGLNVPPGSAHLSEQSVDQSDLQTFYQALGGSRVWFDEQGEPFLQRQQQLEAWVMLSYEQGLDPQTYGLNELSAGHLARMGPQREYWLTQQFLKLARDLNGAAQVGSSDSQWHFVNTRLDVAQLAQRLAQGETVDQLLRSLLPLAPEYARLQTLYQDLLRQQSAYVPELPLPDQLIRPGQRHPVVPQLRRWLIWQHWLAPVSAVDNPEIYDEELVAAVREFQQRNGLKPDGILGPETGAAMQRSVTDRLQQVRANLFRWRALPRQLGNQYVLVRTGAYNLDLVEQGQPIQRHSVITGQPRRPTPSFAASIRRLTFNPYWTVPFRIAVEDLLPKQQVDETYLTEKRIDVLQRSETGQWHEVAPTEVDWSGLSRRNFDYLLRQRPGPGNSLGRMRMDMPNPYSIFLHDTPQQHLFDESRRAFSSGCVRVYRIGELAQRLAGEEAIAEGLAQPDRRYLSLPTAIPVYLVYLTTWVDEAGKAYYHPDVYGRDQTLQQVLGPIPQAPAAELVKLARNVIKK